MKIKKYNVLDLTCTLFWGESKKMKDRISAKLYWQPLQEIPGSFWLPPDLFDLPFWKNYRPDKEQKLIFTARKNGLDIKIWLNEYDVRDYLRSWKNTPSFRVLSVDFSKNRPEKPIKIPYKKTEAWFLIPGTLPSDQEEILTEPIEIKPEPFKEICILSKKLFVLPISQMQLDLFSGLMDSVPVVMARLTDCEALQPETTNTLTESLKTEYDIAAGLLSLLTRVNLKPAWLIARAPESELPDWQNFIFYESSEPARNIHSPSQPLKIDSIAFFKMHHALTRKKLPDFIRCLDEVDAFSDLLIIHNLPKRLKKAVTLLGKIIGWNGTAPNEWAKNLKQAILSVKLENSDRFLKEIAPDERHRCDAWDELDGTLQSLYPLVSGSSPRVNWYNGKQLIERNDLVLELISELILKRLFPEVTEHG